MKVASTTKNLFGVFKSKKKRKEEAYMKLVRAIIAFLAVAVLSLLPLLAEAATPIECETDLLIKEPENPVEERIGGWYVSGEIQGIPVVISVTSNGMTNVAAATTLGIEHLHPKAVFNQGTVGGHDPALHTFDIVLGAKTFDVGAVSRKERKGADGRSIDLRPTYYYDSDLKEKLPAHVCKIYNVPFISIRAISNAEIHGEEFNPVAGTVCQQNVLTVIKSYAKRNIAKRSP